MNLTTLTTAALLSCGALFAAGCAHHQGHERSTGEIIDDSAITTKVKGALLAEKDVNSFDIQVKTFEGVVQLSGFVDSQWQIDKAVQVAAGVHGVQKVKNDLIHKPVK
jgi:hyperosmotically inducible periplasmic protein